jgi:CRISPR-associated protein (Cas_Cas02710)
MSSSKALILLASRPETVEVTVKMLEPEVLGVIVSQQNLEAVTLKCWELRAEGVEFRYRMVDSPMEIGDAFSRFEHLLSELETLGYGRDEVLLDATGGTTPMRLGVALAAMTCGISIPCQRVPQRYVNGRWERNESREVEVLPLHHARVLDRILSSENALDESVLRDLLQKRNRSIPACGLEPIDGNTALRFLEYVDGLVAGSEVRSPAAHATLKRL